MSFYKERLNELTAIKPSDIINGLHKTIDKLKQEIILLKEEINTLKNGE